MEMKNKYPLPIWFNENQRAMLAAQALVECRSMASIVKGAALQYLAQHLIKGIKPISYAKHVPQNLFGRLPKT